MRWIQKSIQPVKLKLCQLTLANNSQIRKQPERAITREKNHQTE